MDETQDNGNNKRETEVTGDIGSKAVQVRNENTEGEIESTENERGGEAVFGAIGGSEETFTTLCQQCLEEECHAEAAMYCTTCDEYLCPLCVNMHQKVRLTKEHLLISTGADDEHFEFVTRNMREPCSSHIGEYLDYFCVSHHSACCLVCKSTYHDKCLNVITISSAINTLSFEQKAKAVITELAQTKAKLNVTISQRQSHIETLDEDRNDSLQALENVRIDVENAVERLNRFLNEDKMKIENRYKEIREKYERDIEKRKNIKDSITVSMEVLNNEKYNDEYKFVHTLKAESSLNAIDETFTEPLDDSKFENIKYEKDSTLDEKLYAVDMLGYIDCEKAIYTVSSAKKTRVVKGTEQISKIVGMCQIDNRTLLLADWHNCCLKLVDTFDNTVRQTVNIVNNPYDICRIGEDKKYAVTLLHARKVKMFALSGIYLISAEGSFQTGEKCRGIAYYNSNLYVTCGGGGTENEGHGHIRVYSLEGKLLKTILHDSFSKPMFTLPCKIRVHPHTDCAFLTDENIISKFNIKSKPEISVFASSCFKRVSFCFDQAGHMFVANYGSKSIDILSADGKRRTALLTNEDVIDAPRDLVFDKENFRLYVALENSMFILCFDIEANKWINPPSF